MADVLNSPGSRSSVDGTLDTLLEKTEELKAAGDQEGLSKIREEVELASWNYRLDTFFKPLMEWNADMVRLGNQDILLRAYRVIQRNRQEIDSLLPHLTTWNTEDPSQVAPLLAQLGEAFGARFDNDIDAQSNRFKQEVLHGKQNYSQSDRMSHGITAVITREAYDKLQSLPEFECSTRELKGRYARIVMQGHVWQSIHGKSPNMMDRGPVQGFRFFVPLAGGMRMDNDGAHYVPDTEDHEAIPSLELADVISLFQDHPVYQRPDDLTDVAVLRNARPRAAFYHNAAYLPDGRANPFAEVDAAKKATQEEAREAVAD